MRKSGILTVIPLLVCLLLTADSQAERTFVKFGTVYSSDHPSVAALKRFQETIKASLEDTMTVQIFADAQLGRADELLNALQFGYLEMAILPVHLLTSHDPLLSILAMPYLFQDTEHLFRVLDGPLGNKLLTTLEEANLVGLGFLYTDSMHIATFQHAVKTPEDMQNMKIGILCPDFDVECGTLPAQISIRSFEDLGAVVNLLTKEEVKQSLQNQTIQALECSPEAALTLPLPQNNMLSMTASAHTTVPVIILASKRWYETLSSDVQKSLRKASRATSLLQRQLLIANEEEAYKTLQARGVQFNPVDREQLRKAVQPLYREMENMLGKKFTDLLQAIQMVH